MMSQGGLGKSSDVRGQQAEHALPALFKRWNLRARPCCWQMAKKALSAAPRWMSAGVLALLCFPLKLLRALRSAQTRAGHLRRCLSMGKARIEQLSALPANQPLCVLPSCERDPKYP